MNEQPRNARAGAVAPRPLRARESRLFVGYLKEHGRAPYQGRPGKDLSYFVRVLSERGKLRTFWGNDLERAVKQSAGYPQFEEKIGIRRVAREPIVRKEPVRDAQGRTIGEVERPAYRTRWEVEKLQVFAERARRARLVRDEQTDISRAVHADPVLKSSFMSVAAAEKYAAQTFKDPAERTRFMTHLRGVLASSIHRGEPVPEVRLRDSPAKPKSNSPAVPAAPKHREDPTR